MTATQQGEVRTLLLAPPSVAEQGVLSRDIFATFDRSASDLQMLDRLAAGMVNLPEATYDLVVILKECNAQHTDVFHWLDRKVYDLLVASMTVGAILKTQCGSLLPATEPILAGLLQTKDEQFEKPEEITVQLCLTSRKKKVQRGEMYGHQSGESAAALESYDLDGYEEGEELVDENALLYNEDLQRPNPQPQALNCRHTLIKRRRACKNCSCGLTERLNADEKERRARTNRDFQAIKLTAANLNDMELDFTTKERLGSCGSCNLGDAFRYANCPYIGLPPFNPGERVEILDFSPQL